MLAFSLLRDIWTLPNLSSGSPGHIQAHRALPIFGSLCRHILVPYLCVDLSLEDQLKCLSYTAHLALVLYAHDNTCGDFLPTALYVDLILMIKNIFFCVAKAKVDTPEEDFSIVLLGTDRLESLFGCLCTIVGNDTNIDNYQLGARLTGTMEATNILALHPDAMMPLSPLLSQDITTVPDSADHISPRSWRALQLLHAVTPPTVWIQGRRQREAEYLFASDILCAPFLTDDVEDVSHDDILHGLAPGVVVQDHTTRDTDTPIIGDGMCWLEDAVTAQEWAPDNHTFTNTVELADNGGLINKCRALSLMFKYSKSTSSTDRLHQVQQQAHFLQSESNVLLDDSPNEGSNILLVHNPMAFLLACNNSLFLCLGEIIAIHMGPKSINHLPLDVLHEDSIRVTIQAYSLVSTSPEECVHKNDWRTCGHLPMKFKVPGPLIQPLNPCLVTPPSHSPYYLFDTGTLISLASTLHDCLTNPYLKLVPNTESSHQFPYHEKSGLACFVAETLNEICDYSGHECPTCVLSVWLDASNGQCVLAHIRSHILHDPSIDLSQEPCGLCLRPATLCLIYLIKRTGWNSQWSLKYGGIVPCPNATTFSYTAAMISSKSSPCSNVPLVCPYCLDGSPVVWRYNMHHHLENCHRSIDPEKHIEIWKLTPDEMEVMEAIWDARHCKQTKQHVKGKQKVPLKLSEAHSSHSLTKNNVIEPTNHEKRKLYCA
ncbi:hypothetical protein EI94DRAFT_1607575 [Lactarius quietus]|nr:hypothetical protein EI94DRAFT_1607575 [Lactarius quietus]